METVSAVGPASYQVALRHGIRLGSRQWVALFWQLRSGGGNLPGGADEPDVRRRVPFDVIRRGPAAD
jgi:hypothetical protein